jgi:threonine dehydratase
MLTGGCRRLGSGGSGSTGWRRGRSGEAPHPTLVSLDVEPIGQLETRVAARRIAGAVRRTPLLVLEPGALGVDHPLVAKLDVLQPTGSFKVRGALSLLTGVPVPPAGVVAASGGNFGLAVAWAAARLGVPATIVVPASTPQDKLAPFVAFDATLRVVDGYYADALAVADDLAAATGALRAHAYDQAEVVAGQGTAALEVLEDTEVDTVMVACGGGGLLAGTIAAVDDRAQVVAVETHGTATLHAALAAGQPVDVEVGGLAASSLGAARIGELAWAARGAVARSIVVSDDDVRDAQRRLWSGTRLVAEPGGATALAALTSGAYVPAAGERVAVLVCGANTDPATVVRPSAPPAPRDR